MRKTWSSWLLSTIASVSAYVLAGGVGHADPASIARAFPYALICSSNGATAVGYLTRVDPDGSAVYFAITGQFAIVGTDGRVQIDESRKSGDCSGHTIDELRASRQAIDFPE